jgi:hypothetical protein
MNNMFPLCKPQRRAIAPGRVVYKFAGLKKSKTHKKALLDTKQERAHVRVGPASGNREGRLPVLESPRRLQVV